MKRNLIYSMGIFLISLSCMQISCLAQGNEENIVIGKLVKIHSAILNEDRTLQIYLPRAYQQSKTKYPVIYLLDGEWNFHCTTGIVQFLASENLIPKMIIVGIPNTIRYRDFPFTKNERIPDSGGGKNFLKFMEKELFPFIEKNYNTQPFRLLIGHGYGGHFTIYTLLSRPELFNAYIGISARVHDIDINIESALEKLPHANKFLFMTVGNEPRRIPQIEKFIDIVKNKAPKNLDWDFKLFKDDDHGSVVHISIYEGLRAIFSDIRIPNKIADKGIDEIESYYRKLGNKYGYKINVPEDIVNSLGYRLLRKNHKGAIEIFKYNVEHYPHSANVYNSLGKGYEANNQLELAKKYYEIACKKGKENSDLRLDLYRINLINIQKGLSEK